MAINMLLHNLGNREKVGYTTWGCMWEKGHCTLETGFILKNEAKVQVPMQSRVTAYWPDGSVKWTSHTADAARLGDSIEVLIGSESEKKEKIELKRSEEKLTVLAGSMVVTLALKGNELFQTAAYEGKTYLADATPVLMLEEPSVWEGNPVKIEKKYTPRITEVTVEEEGELQVILKYTGHHELVTGEEKIPFHIRMKIGLNSPRLDFVHTFYYDGDEEKDFLKGLGIRFHSPLKGELYNRHVRFMGDNGVFHESLAQLLTWRPRIPEDIYKRQVKGQLLVLEGEDKKLVDTVMKAMPFWSEYDLCQDSASHYLIRKKIKDENCCYLDSLHGNRTEGGAAFGSEQGSVLFSIRDFWEKYPSGYTFKNLDTDVCEATIWFWSPKAETMDFRHYANRGYNQVYYEGYDYKGATPYGIACTSECSVKVSDKLIPSDKEITQFAQNVKQPVQYIGTPEFYHRMKAFGYWSLPTRNTQTENWLEEQLERAVAFYAMEVKQRNWYGMFNYGDFMHTYDKERHQWRYDMGGYAWDNTELVPTLWLWYAFMRTGREEIFTLAEKLSRHASEVDVYHLGKYKGLGSRHNVRHWGCPCKEARIAMAAHHRFYYYLTGDRRFEDIFEELKDNEMTFLNKDPLGDFYAKEEMVYKSHARSGPDWSSLCANWMTRWERFNDKKYRDKITTGIEDIKKAPLKLISGPDFEFDPASVRLRYIGENAAGGTHLQICMGAPQVFMELADLLEDEEWKKMIADYGRFYYLPREEQIKESGGIIGKREFSLPFMAAAMGAYGANYLKDDTLAERTWRILLQTLISEGNHDGFKEQQIENKGNQKTLIEIPWITTNFVAQWCLNVIVVLAFIREKLPKTLEEVDKLVEDMSAEGFRKA
ncbi:exo-rhamnogalacturonan lyase family protein [Anaerocolumna cellulosilytica]|nr:hypothetical protein [Anaerocolumna cellulosilytica]MBB5194780.1 hypothetical protein [Anaerocolumna cellulosilytica]